VQQDDQRALAGLDVVQPDVADLGLAVPNFIGRAVLGGAHCCLPGGCVSSVIPSSIFRVSGQIFPRLRQLAAAIRERTPHLSARLGGWLVEGAVTLGQFLMGQGLTGKQSPHEIRRHLNLGGRR
jgi:hypothetical protein